MELTYNLKRLRQQHDMTQESMAEALGITPQAISRWETGQAMPAISLIPALANLFDVTTDELFGMQEIRRTERLHDAFSKAQSLRSQGNYMQSAALLREELSTFPHNFGLMTELALSLSYDSASLSEALSLCERVLEDAPEGKLKSTARSLAVLLYPQTQQSEKSLSLVRNFPHIWESREMLLTCIGNAEERQRALDACITTALTLCLYKLQSPTLQQDKDLLGQGLSVADVSPRELLNTLLQYYT